MNESNEKDLFDVGNTPQDGVVSTSDPMTPQPLERHVVDVSGVKPAWNDNLFYSKVSDIQIREPEWMIGNLVPLHSKMTLVVAAENSGKTFLVIDWMMTYILGNTEWRGHQINAKSKTRRVVYIYSESNENDIMTRVHGYLHYHNIPVEAIDGKFILLNYKELCNCVDNPRLTDETMELIKESLINKYGNEIDCFVFDTLNGLLEGDENSNTDASIFLTKILTLLTPFDASGIIIHHSGVASIGLPIEEVRPRGATCIPCRVDYVVTCKGDLGNPNGGLQLYVKKARDTKKGKEWVRGKVEYFKDSDGVEISTLVISDEPSDEIERGVGQAMEALQKGRVTETTLADKASLEEWINTGKLKVERDEYGHWTFRRDDLKAVMKEEWGSKKKNLNQETLPTEGKFIGRMLKYSLIEYNEEEEVETYNFVYMLHNNLYIPFDKGMWNIHPPKPEESDNDEEEEVEVDDDETYISNYEYQFDEYSDEDESLKDL